MNQFNSPKIIVALDFPDQNSAINLVNQLDPKLCRLKVGFEMFTKNGPRFVEDLMKKGFEIFLDLKFHDIPNTVAGACTAAASLGVWMINMHTLGGRKMMIAAREAIDKVSGMPLDKKGFRGVVLLKKGRYELAEPVRITAGGVGLRGEGQDEDGTVLIGLDNIDGST